MERSNSHVGNSESSREGQNVQVEPNTPVGRIQIGSPASGSVRRPSNVRSLQSCLLKLDILLYLTLLASTGFAVLYVGRGKVFELNPRPFFLGDTTLWYEYKQADTFPIWTVFVTSYVGFGGLIAFGEYHLATRGRGISPASARLTAARFGFGVWVCTMAATMLVEWTKNYVGRLRPNFAERCLGSGAVPPPGGPASLMRVIHDNSECVSGALWGGAWDGRRSFPSGHAALAMGAAVYLQLWLMRYASVSPRPWRGFVASFGAVLAIAYGVWVGSSRVVDNAHHVSDVVGGAGIGGWLAAAHFWRVERETTRAEQIYPDGSMNGRVSSGAANYTGLNNGMKEQ